MEKKSQIWNQYADLRSELRQANILNSQILGIVIAAAAAILTTGFKETEPLNRVFIFLAIYVVTWPGYGLL